ncbi:MAG: hypothetical protein JNL32_08400, partial [Candidatus Kapabacteria bacterium]|nr:hypothetical protein [Candidatus Kapabacteria bacterium]
MAAPDYANHFANTIRTGAAMRIIRLILYTVLIAVIASNLVAQNYGRRIGINASYLFAQTSISLKKIDGTQSCCPLYTSGTGNGVAISALGEMQISGSFILGLRAVGSSFSNTMVTPEEMPVFNPSTNQPVRGVFEHRLEASFATLGIEPVFSLRLFDFLSLNQSIGISTVLNRSFRQYEQITEPGNFGTFIINGVDTKKRVNNDTRGDIPNANSLRMTVAAGLSTEFALGAAKNIWIAPEVWYEYALTDVVPSVADESWRISMIRAGLSLKYGTPFINDFDAIIRRKIIIDTITIKQDGITAPVVRTGVPRIGADTLFNADDGDAVITQYVRRIDTLFVPAPTVLPTATLVIRSSDSQEPLTELKAEESIATTSYIPLLRYIFFDEASAAIPARYAKLRSDATDDFRLSSDEVRNTLLCYRHLLNIIGGRMRKNDTSTLTLTGYAPDGTTTTNTESSTKLALER